VLKNTEEMIGFLGLMTPSFEAAFTPAVEIGWRLSPTHWNKGYATEGAKAVLNYAFTDLQLKEVVSFTVINNQASRRVMEKIGLLVKPVLIIFPMFR
jgi:RimJ/RimL family protein N-acetyltransferase